MNKIIASILISSYNAEKFIRPTIESIINQDFDKNSYEIIIVDDGSKDKTIKILNDYIKRFTNLKVLSQENQGPSVAYSRLLIEAKGEYLFLMSHDCRAESYWLRDVIAEFEKNPKVAIVQGKLLPTRPFDRPVFHCNNFTSFQVTFDTAEVAYRASAVDAVGRYFQEDFSTNGHDADMAWRLIEKGYSYVWLDKVLMYHDIIPRSFWADAKSYYLMQYFPKLLKIHPGMRKFIPYGLLWASAFKYAFVGGLVLSLIVGILFSLKVAVLVLLLTIAFSLLRALRSAKDYNISLIKKIFVFFPHRVIGESLLGFYLLYGSIRYRSLVI